MPFGGSNDVGRQEGEPDGVRDIGPGDALLVRHFDDATVDAVVEQLMPAPDAGQCLNERAVGRLAAIRRRPVAIWCDDRLPSAEALEAIETIAST